MPVVVIGGCPTPTLLSPQVIRPSYSDIRRHFVSVLFVRSTRPRTLRLLLAARLDKVITQGTAILLASAKNNWWLFDLGMLCFFAAATSERFPDGTISDVISCRSPRWCGPAMPFPREARLYRISQAPSRVSGLFRVTRRKI
jgi:hypothetical protein